MAKSMLSRDTASAITESALSSTTPSRLTSYKGMLRSAIASSSEIRLTTRLKAADPSASKELATKATCKRDPTVSAAACSSSHSSSRCVQSLGHLGAAGESCQVLKQWIEARRLHIHDRLVISEQINAAATIASDFNRRDQLSG